jgi:hypothetical protein
MAQLIAFVINTIMPIVVTILFQTPKNLDKKKCWNPKIYNWGLNSYRFFTLLVVLELIFITFTCCSMSDGNTQLPTWVMQALPHFY